MDKPTSLYFVTHGYACTLTGDNTTVLCVKTELPDGVYTQDGLADGEVTSIYSHKLNRPVEFANSITIRRLIESILGNVASVGLSGFKPILQWPKLNKAVADGLDKMLETMSFMSEDTHIAYLCMGARKRLEAVLGDNLISVSPGKFYAGTQFKGNLFGRKTAYALLIVDDSLEHVSMLFKIDLEKRSEAIDAQRNL